MILLKHILLLTELIEYCILTLYFLNESYNFKAYLTIIYIEFYLILQSLINVYTLWLPLYLKLFFWYLLKKYFWKNKSIIQRNILCIFLISSYLCHSFSFFVFNYFFLIFFLRLARLLTIKNTFIVRLIICLR